MTLHFEMVVSAGKVADLPRVGMLSSLGEFSEPNKWSWIRPYRCHLEEDPRHHTMVGIVLP